jgi:riboflavin kinase/FMN adenylyltransferase
MVMQHYWSLDEINLQDTWLTIGSFDGVHLGHQAILNGMISGARSDRIPTVVLTFFPHPRTILKPNHHHLYLTSPEDRARILTDLGIDVVITHPFNHIIAMTPAHEFINKLHNSLHMSQLWVGYDFALGRGRDGDLSKLRHLGVDYGYSTNVVNPIEVKGEIVSSRLIRAALKEGDLPRTNLLLGRSYQLSGEVVHGDGRGKTLGIPTANLSIWADQALPKPGVYVCKVFMEGEIKGAVTNIGVRPTFGKNISSPQVETHIFDFTGDLYGRQIRLSFFERLRDEQRFSTIQALVCQIQSDIKQAKRILLSENQQDEVL